MFPAQTQHDSNSGDLFKYEKERVTLSRRADNFHPTSSTAIMLSDIPYVLEYIIPQKKSLPNNCYAIERAR